MKKGHKVECHIHEGEYYFPNSACVQCENDARLANLRLSKENNQRRKEKAERKVRENAFEASGKVRKEDKFLPKREIKSRLESKLDTFRPLLLFLVDLRRSSFGWNAFRLNYPVKSLTLTGEFLMAVLRRRHYACLIDIVLILKTNSYVSCYGVEEHQASPTTVNP